MTIFFPNVNVYFYETSIIFSEYEEYRFRLHNESVSKKFHEGYYFDDKISLLRAGLFTEKSFNCVSLNSASHVGEKLVKKLKTVKVAYESSALLGNLERNISYLRASFSLVKRTSDNDNVDFY